MQGVIFVDHILVRNLLIMMWQRNQVDLFLYYCRNFQVSLWRSPNRSYRGTRCHPQKYLGFYNQEAIFQISFASNTIFRPTLPQMQSQPLKFCLLLLLILALQSYQGQKGNFKTYSFWYMDSKMSPNFHLLLCLDPFQCDCRFAHQEVQSITPLCELG